MGTVVRNAEDKVHKERKTNLLVLVREYLADEGYVDTLKVFDAETKLPRDWVLCDNVDLDAVVEDFESYFFVRFKKYPKISRKVNSKSEIADLKTKERKKPVTIVKPKSEPVDSSRNDKLFDSEFLKVASVGGRGDFNSKPDVSLKLWKGLGTFEGFNDDWKAFADIISREVIDRNLNVKWDDVIGLDTAKQHLKESIVYPMKYPEFFKGITSPWKGLLLYGPSGTGKTLLAKAVASECSTTFFNISASSLVSKWRGDSEKLVRIMFELARHQAPSTIFIDEIDSLASKRDCPTEHEASRRFKSEFLVQLDGLINSSDNVFLLTTSNLPWDLDPAVLRRLEKRIFVDLPDEKSREFLFSMYLPATINKFITTKLDYNSLAKQSQNYSGADIKLVCKEAVMTATRIIIPLLEKRDFSKIKAVQVTTEIVMEALSRVKPVSYETHKYREWPS